MPDRFGEARQRLRGTVACSPETSAAAQCCTTRRQNTHGTEVRELLYPWHPWFGEHVHVHAALAKRVDIFRCSLSGVPSDRLLEVPAWMFDRAVSGYWRSLPVPHVDLSSLYALAKLLEDAEASSQSAVTGAALVSHETSRRDVHAPPVHDISVRSVLGPAAGEDSRDAAMAGVAGGDPPSVDGAHRTAIRRSRKVRTCLPTEGGRS
jgi:hypothetical protein